MGGFNKTNDLREVGHVLTEDKSSIVKVLESLIVCYCISNLLMSPLSIGWSTNGVFVTHEHGDWHFLDVREINSWWSLGSIDDKVCSFSVIILLESL